MSRRATRRRQEWCSAGRSGYDTPGESDRRRSRLKRQICRRMVFRFLMAGGVLLSALLPVYLRHSLNVQHLALLQAAFDEREICLEPQRAELARQRALQRQAETENLRQQQTARENRRYGICWFLQAQLPEDAAGALSGRAAKHDTESSVRHALSVNRRQVIASSHPLLQRAPRADAAQADQPAASQNSGIRQFILVTGGAGHESEHSMALCAVPARAVGSDCGIWLSAGVVFWCFICNRQRETEMRFRQLQRLTALSEQAVPETVVLPPRISRRCLPYCPKMRCRC